MMGGRRLHVHILINSLRHGGAETLLADFATAATDAGIDVSLSYLQDHTEMVERLRAIGIEPAYVPIGSILHPHDRGVVRDHLASVGADLVHTHLGTSDYLGCLAARKVGIPAVSTLHVMDWIWARGGRERLKMRMMARARRRGAARVIAVSEAARRSYVEAGLDSPERVVAVHNGVVDAARPGAGPRIRRQLGVGDDELVLAMVSVLRHGKGHDVAVAALRKLGQRFANLRLLVIGEGPERPNIERVAREQGVSVTMCGFRDDVQAVLDAADVLVHPSNVDALPTALIEAMAAAVPAVATAVGGIPELVVEGETGILIAPPPTPHHAAKPDDLAAALVPLLADRALRLRLGARGRERFESQYTAGRWIERLMPIYEAAMSGPRAR